MRSRLLVILIAAAAVLSATLYVVVRIKPNDGGGSVQSGAQAPSPRALYAQHCASCHGGTGKGDGAEARVLLTRPKDFTAPGYLAGYQDAFLFDIIKEGGSIFGKPAMPRWAHLLTDEEIRGLVAYVRALEARR